MEKPRREPSVATLFEDGARGIVEVKKDV